MHHIIFIHCTVRKGETILLYEICVTYYHFVYQKAIIHLIPVYYKIHNTFCEFPSRRYKFKRLFCTNSGPNIISHFGFINKIFVDCGIFLANLKGLPTRYIYYLYGFPSLYNQYSYTIYCLFRAFIFVLNKVNVMFENKISSFPRFTTIFMTIFGSIIIY